MKQMIRKTARKLANRTSALVTGASMFAMPLMAMAQEGGLDGSGAEGRVTTFFENLTGILNVASIAIVTVAVIFAGYQIAFNQKRISDVAPVLIGGFLIGAAAQIAKMLLPSDVMAHTSIEVVSQLLQYA